jgi:hypothetical protein
MEDGTMTRVSTARWRMTRRRLLAAVLVVAGSVALATQAGQAGTHRYPLDDVPGFGRSPEAVLRDDTIAYWEAYRREAEVSVCMGEAGFLYEMDVAFPEGVTRAVASALGVEAERTPRPTPSPSQGNAAYVESLTSDRRDGYYRALYDESTVDVEVSRANEAVPEGRGEDFARGGCVGAAERLVGSVWDARRALDEDYEAERRKVGAALAASDTADAYAECVREVSGVTVSSPAEVYGTEDERLLEKGPELVACEKIWSSGYADAEGAMAERFAERHREELSEGRARYEGVMARIEEDGDLRVHLADVVTRAAATPSQPISEGEG